MLSSWVVTAPPSPVGEPAPVKEKQPTLAKSANRLAFVCRTDRAGRVLNDRQSMAVGEGIDFVHSCWQAEQVDCDYCLGAWCDSRSECLGMQIVGREVNVGEYRPRTDIFGAMGAGDTGERRNNDFIAIWPKMPALRDEVYKLHAGVVARACLTVSRAEQ